MKVTADSVAQHLTDYLHRSLSLADLVTWAENAMMDSEFDDREVEIITPIVARLGLADVKEFGVTWDDCYSFLGQLGYQVNVVVSKAA
jgi:hypothetical protein